MSPGEYLIDDGEHELNPGRDKLSLVVANSGDRPIQVGSHYHFAETNAALRFDREATTAAALIAAVAARYRVRDLTVEEIVGDPFPILGEVASFDRLVGRGHFQAGQAPGPALLCGVKRGSDRRGRDE